MFNLISELENLCKENDRIGILRVKDFEINIIRKELEKSIEQDFGKGAYDIRGTAAYFNTSGEDIGKLGQKYVYSIQNLLERGTEGDVNNFGYTNFDKIFIPPNNTISHGHPEIYSVSSAKSIMSLMVKQGFSKEIIDGIHPTILVYYHWRLRAKGTPFNKLIMKAYAIIKECD